MRLIAPATSPSTKDDALVALSHVLEEGLDHEALDPHLAEQLHERCEISARPGRYGKRPSRGIAVDRLHDDLAMFGEKSAISARLRVIIVSG